MIIHKLGLENSLEREVEKKIESAYGEESAGNLVKSNQSTHVHVTEMRRIIEKYTDLSVCDISRRMLYKPMLDTYLAQ